MRRVVITGMGAVTPLGNTLEATWLNLSRGQSGLTGISKFDPSGLPSRIAGELKGFDPLLCLSGKDVLRLDPFVHYAAAAALMAAEDAGFEMQHSEVSGQRSAVIIGSSRGGISSLEKALERDLIKGRPFSAYVMSSSTINMASAYVSMRMGITGPALGISTACASGTTAVGEALWLIRRGGADIVFAGGSEAPLCRLAVGGYGASGALSRRNDDPEKASRPFDRDRDGFVLAEGSGILVLEDLDHALNRGARIYAELAGYGASSDAFHQTRPDSRGEAQAISGALRDAGVMAEEVGYINAHGTSTQLGDAAEVQAINDIFGSGAAGIAVSSCKSMLGHMLGAAGAVEAAVTALSVSRGIITPTINLEHPAAECGLDHVTSALRRDIEAALTNSFGFGGVNAVLVLRKFIGEAV